MKRKIVFLTCIVVALGLFIALFEKPNRFEPENKFSLFPDLKSTEIGAIEIDYFVKGTRLEKGNQNQWWVTEKETELGGKIAEKTKNEDKKSPQREEADTEKVTHMIEVLTGLQVGLPVSTNPDKQNELQVGNSGLKVTLFDAQGEKKEILRVGKQGPTLFSTFVRKEGKNEIYLVDEYLSGIVNLPLDAWKKKEAISPPLENTP